MSSSDSSPERRPLPEGDFMRLLMRHEPALRAFSRALSGWRSLRQWIEKSFHRSSAHWRGSLTSRFGGKSTLCPRLHSIGVWTGGKHSAVPIGRFGVVRISRLIFPIQATQHIHETKPFPHCFRIPAQRRYRAGDTDKGPCRRRDRCRKAEHHLRPLRRHGLRAAAELQCRFRFAHAEPRSVRAAGDAVHGRAHRRGGLHAHALRGAHDVFKTDHSDEPPTTPNSPPSLRSLRTSMATRIIPHRLGCESTAGQGTEICR